MNNEQTKRGSWEHFLLRAAQEKSLSEAQYNKISSRYDQLERILSASTDPLLAEAHIFVQGSIGLRTTIKPVPGAPEELATIDADAIVWLPHAQGADASDVLIAIETRFREGSRVEEDIQQLRRGIRIVYADENPGFHIDVTPARSVLGNNEGNGRGMLEVPDREIGWKPSSPLPYSEWLNVVSTQQIFLESSVTIAKSLRTDAATQDPLPVYEDYADQDPLRATIKLLKAHRDEWAIRSHNEKNRPISAVITTLATHAYFEVADESKGSPLTPLDAIIEIVRRMPSHIKYEGDEYKVCNPKDFGENFAEKWNRPQEGQNYLKAFHDWHESAFKAVRLGLETYPNAHSFVEAVKENFGMGHAFVTEINKEIPVHWTLPGRPEGTTRNSISLSALSGGLVAGEKAQGVEPVERLG